MTKSGKPLFRFSAKLSILISSGGGFYWSRRGQECGDPDTCAFFDHFHRTTATHPVPARLRTATVPEPFTIILLRVALDPVRDSLDFVAVWIDRRLQDGWVIRILLVIAVVVMVIQVIQGRRSSETFGPLREKVRHLERRGPARWERDSESYDP
jgi:hypothetical protein